MMKRKEAASASQSPLSGRKQRTIQPQVGHVSQLLTIDQVAARLSVHRTTVYDFIKMDGLRVTRLAAHAVRIDEADLKLWVEQRKAV